MTATKDRANIPNQATLPSETSKPYAVIVDGIDYTEYVTGISTQIQLDEMNTSSTFNLKADSAEENSRILVEFLKHCNKYSAVKVYIRGYYTNKLTLRMSGYTVTCNGANPFTGFTITTRRTTTEGGDNAGNPNTSDAPPYEYKRVDEIVRDIIKKKGYVVGKIDDFPQVWGQWLPGNRSIWEQLQVLADAAGAVVTLRPPKTFAINKNGDLSTTDFFEVPLQADGLTPKETYSQRILTFRKGTASDGGTNTGLDDYTLSAARALTDDISKGNLTPIVLTPKGGGKAYPIAPPNVGPNYGPGQANKNDRTKITNSNDTIYYDKDDGMRKAADKAAQQMEMEKIDPALRAMIEKANKYYYRNVSTGEVEEMVMINDGSGGVSKPVMVPISVAIQTMKGDMVVDFLKADEKVGYLGSSGLILTLKEGDLRYPYIRVKSITGFDYTGPTAPQDKAQSGPGASSITGAMGRDFVTAKQKITPTDSVADFAAKNPNLVQKVHFNNEDLYVFYDPSLLRVDRDNGRVMPMEGESSKQTVDANGVRTDVDNTIPMSPEKFRSMTRAQWLVVYKKTRAAYFNSSTDEFMRRYYSKEWNERKYSLEHQGLTPEGKPYDERAYNDFEDQMIAKEQKINPYVQGPNNTEEKNIYKVGDLTTLPPILSGKESILNALRGANSPTDVNAIEKANALAIQNNTPIAPIEVYIGGQSLGGTTNASGTRTEDGKAGPGDQYHFRPNTIMFNPATGALFSGEEFNKKEATQAFSMTIEVDAAVEVVPGQLINCDDTFGPFEGPYVIDVISEGITQSSATSTYTLVTQAVMTGRARAANTTPYSASEATENVAGGAAGPYEGTPVKDMSAPKNITPQGSAKAVVDSGMNAITSDWAVKTPGWCSAFQRAAYEHAYDLPSTIDHGGALSSIFGGTAAETGAKMRAHNLGRTLASIGGMAGLEPGDLLITENTDLGQGHIAMYDGAGNVIENTTRNHATYDGRTISPASVMNKATLVVKQKDIDAYIRSQILPKYKR